MTPKLLCLSILILLACNQSKRVSQRDSNRATLDANQSENYDGNSLGSGEQSMNSVKNSNVQKATQTSKSTSSSNSLSSLFGGALNDEGEGPSENSQDDSAALTIEADPRFKEPFLSPFLNKPGANYLTTQDRGKANISLFSCPGDSFMVGQEATYDASTGDRSYAVRCQFFADGRGYPMKKVNCKISEKANEPEGPLQFSCPSGTLMAGHQSAFQSVSKDRIHRFECCEMHNPENKKVLFQGQGSSSEDTPTKCDMRHEFEQDQQAQEVLAAEGVNQDVNAKMGRLHFACSSNAVIHKIKGNYFGSSSSTISNSIADRVFSYNCCELGIDGAAPPSSQSSLFPF